MFDEEHIGVLTDDGKLVINEAYCHNGHDLLDNELEISGYPSIKLLVSDKKHEEIINISAVEGDQQRKFKKGFADKTLLTVSCPMCKEELDNIAPCDCVKGSKYVAIYLNKKRTFGGCVGVCNSWGCFRSFMGSAWRIISRLADKTSK